MKGLEMWVLSKVSLMIFFASLFTLFYTYYDNQRNMTITEDLSILAKKISQKANTILATNAEYVKEEIELPARLDVGDVKSRYKLTIRKLEGPDDYIISITIETITGRIAKGASSFHTKDALLDNPSYDDDGNPYIEIESVTTEEYANKLRKYIILEKENEILKISTVVR